ncbi:hypothetical protein F4009_09125 [Candidatus Poribacteria bacterium]|nr:hypothetical protein [Candidatus Poribacteria bacterium]MYK94136.1 hypothetical protein [Candidatus Poribacteria bacterium]
MNAKIFGKINHFLKSEEGRVGLKTPMVLGIASGSLLLVQSVLSPSAYAEGHECYTDYDCDPGESCVLQCDGSLDNGTCDGTWVYKCVGS